MNQGKPIHPIKKLREKQGLTTSELGVLIGKQSDYLALIEDGFTEINREIFNKLCNVLNIETGQLKQDIKIFKTERDKFLHKMLNDLKRKDT